MHQITVNLPAHSLKLLCLSRAAVYPPVPAYHQCLHSSISLSKMQSCIHSLPHQGTHVLLRIHPPLSPLSTDAFSCSLSLSLVSQMLAALHGAGLWVEYREHREGWLQEFTVWQGKRAIDTTLPKPVGRG